MLRRTHRFIVSSDSRGLLMIKITGLVDLTKFSNSLKVNFG